ncbi:MAG: valine--tRNA ligase [Bacilli bacterium]
METKYNHLEVEKGKSKDWRNKQIFNAGNKSKEPFTIVIPPPNITSKLHIGHALDLTLQDIIIRYKRMSGYDALWLSGMDHAGIATQAKVDERLATRGISRYEIGREKFLEEAWQWKVEHEEIIHNQWETLGLSLDYSREKFTLDPELNKAVEHVFIEMYQKGLIYRGERIINWDPKAKTALSNIEVIHKDVTGAEHYFKYVSVDNPDEYLEIMTTRPETMFGDGALAVHPDDDRYIDLVGKYYYVPNTDIAIPVIADKYVTMDKGSGVVKITMAHDPNDFEVAKRHNLEPHIIMNEDGTMASNEFVPVEFQGLDRFEARKKQVKLADEKGLLIKVEEITHSVGHSERTGVVVEPYLSKQWFVKMENLAKRAVENQQTEGKVNFFPKRAEKVFLNWMEEIHDWCISRQLWWGHRIPAWYKDEDVYVGYECPGEEWVQDEDVLDTWFSSALWPFSSLGWNENSDDFNRYYPTSTLSTGFDIIFFWVSRMIFQALEFTDTAPFKDVVIHGLIRDEQGRKMSKSLGNGIDPIDMIEKYGTDALRWYLTTTVTQGADLNFQEEKLEASWNFINKVWNASRYVDMQLGEDFKASKIDYKILTLTDKWILNKFNNVLNEINRNMENYEFVVVGNVLYEFIWNDVCNWYLEFSKITLNSGDETLGCNTKNILHYMLTNILKLLHPFMPFVTEEIYNSIIDDGYLSLSEWPKELKENDFDKTEITDSVIDLIKKVRTLRLEKSISNKVSFPIIIKVSEEDFSTFESNLDILEKFMNSNEIKIFSNYESDVDAITFVNDYAMMFIMSSDIIDKEEEINRLKLEIKNVKSEIKRAEGMLANEKFVSKAPASKVNEEKKKLENYKNQLINLEDSLKKLG